MNNNKKIFVVIALLFLLLVLYLSYDISTRTTFPGSKNTVPQDTVIKEEK